MKSDSISMINFLRSFNKALIENLNLRDLSEDKNKFISVSVNCKVEEAIIDSFIESRLYHFNSN